MSELNNKVINYLFVFEFEKFAWLIKRKRAKLLEIKKRRKHNNENKNKEIENKITK